MRASPTTRRIRAVDDVSFPVGAGRLTGSVGANGAGKTTTMRIVLGLRQLARLHEGSLLRTNSRTSIRQAWRTTV